jgi:ABC-2 type transport system permease protein
MRWHRIVRKELLDARRTRTLLTTVGLFVLVGGLMGYFSGGLRTGPVARQLPVALLGASAFLVPLVALGISYRAVVGPRADGSLGFLLALPYDRRDVLVGTYAGQVAVLAASLLAGFLALGVTALLRGVLVSPAVTATALVASVALGVVFVAIGIGISTAVGSPRTAGAAAFVAFALFFFFWSSVPGLLAYVLNGFSVPAEPPAWGPAVRTLNPVAAFGIVADALVPGGEFGAGALTGETLRSVPLAAGVMLGWAVLAPLAGYLRFRNADL